MRTTSELAQGLTEVSTQELTAKIQDQEAHKSPANAMHFNARKAELEPLWRVRKG